VALGVSSAPRPDDPQLQIDGQRGRRGRNAHGQPGLETAVYFLLGWIVGLSAIVVWRRHGTDRIRLMILGGAVYALRAPSCSA